MKLSELTENDVIHIRTKKEAKGIAKLCTDTMKSRGGGALSNMVIKAYSTYKENTFIRVKPLGEYAENIDDFDAVPMDLKIIPASKFLKSTPTKKELLKRIEALEERNSIVYVGSENHTIRLTENVEEGLPEFVSGKWYKFGNALACYSTMNSGYGFSVFGKWGESISMTHRPSWQPATDTEVFEALKAEAESRYKIGDVVNGVSKMNDPKALNCKLVDTSFYICEPDSKNGITVHGNTDKSTWDKNHSNPCLFEDGIWATIIPQPEAIDWSKPGQLVEKDGLIVKTSGESHNDTFTGSPVSGKIDYNQRYFSKVGFTLCTEPVTLKN